MMRRTILFALLLAIVAGVQTSYLVAGKPSGYVLNANLEPGDDGVLRFVADSNGDTGRIRWNSVIAKTDPPPPGSHKGKLTATTGGPFDCACPNAENTCQCVFVPGPGGIAVDLQRN